MMVPALFLQLMQDSLIAYCHSTSCVCFPVEVFGLHATAHYHLYSRPVQLEASGTLTLAGQPVPTVACRGLAEAQFAASFERTIALLGQRERMFVELDGAFVWSGETESRAWQIDGMLYDRGGHVSRIELKGTCPRSAWQELLPAFGWPQQAMVVHLVDHQCFVELPVFLERLTH